MSPSQRNFLERLETITINYFDMKALVHLNQCFLQFIQSHGTQLTRKTTHLNAIFDRIEQVNMDDI